MRSENGYSNRNFINDRLIFVMSGHHTYARQALSVRLLWRID